MQQHLSSFARRVGRPLTLVMFVACNDAAERFSQATPEHGSTSSAFPTPPIGGAASVTSNVDHEGSGEAPPLETEVNVAVTSGDVGPSRPLPVVPESSAPTADRSSTSGESGAGVLSSESRGGSGETDVVSDLSTRSETHGEPTPSNGPDDLPDLPDAGTEGDGNFELGPSYSAQRDLNDLGAPKGRRFEFRMRLADSGIFDGRDATLDPAKRVNSERSIVVYVPAQYVAGTPAPLLVIQDGPGDISLVQNALDNLTASADETRRLPAFVAIAVQNGGDDAQGSQRGLEYDTMSDRYARFIDEEVLPAVVADPAIAAAYPNLRFTTDPSGRASLGCSSGGAAALTMGWFRPDLFGRIITYSGTFVDQQDHDAPEVATYPDGAWGYHSNQKLIETTPKKPLRIFLNVNENDLRADDPESTLHNWVMANERTAAALAEQGYHYRYVFGRGVGHCDGSIRRATLADALIWVWRGYQGQ